MITRALSFDHNIFLEDTNLTILTRQERERLVLELYNQGKTIREIAKEARMSFRDIGAVLNKVIEEKSEGIKQQDDAEENQQQHLSLCTQAYELFSEGKTPIEVAIALNIPASKISKLYREYWKLKRLHRLYSAYTELGDEGFGAFLKLYRLMKEIGISIEQAVSAIYAAIHKLPYIENLYEQVKEQVERMQHIRQGLANDIEERKKKISLLDNIITLLNKSARENIKKYRNLLLKRID
jgi:DNA-binding CsgD family transcriptional regulator